ncbi:MAG: metal ABC transporter permease [Acetivibrionales bacterium]|jgi:zinc transport system permease protein|nr:metal ABC transporter permease [Clostridiaceae bacterium]
MEWWYKLLEILPFEWAEPGRMIFMKNALLAIIILTPIFAILGTMVINKNMSFFSDALGHGAFTGVAIGSLMGFVRPVGSAVLFSIIFALLISVVKHKSKMSSDTIIGVFSSMSIALGIFLATLGGKSFAKLNTYLIGDILSISPEEIGFLAIVLVLIIIFWLFFFNHLLVVSINASLAGSRGIKTFWYEVVFSIVLAVVVTISMSWIGLLVINSFLVLPAASARNIARNQRQYHFLSIVFSVFSGVSGLIMSYYIETATGSTIVLISAIIFFTTYALRKKFL